MGEHICYNYPKYIVCFGFTLGAVDSMGLDKYKKTYIHHFNTIKGNPSALLVGMQTGEATVENSMEFPQKTKNGTAL